MDHKVFLASLSVDQRDRLTARSDVKGLLHLAGHLGAIAVFSAVLLSGWPLWWLALLPQGILLIFLFTLLHETSHKTPFASDRLNVLVGQLCGFFLFIPATWFRYFHFAHHRYTQVPGKDPELDVAKPETAWHYMWHVSGVPVWVSLAKVFLGLVTGRKRDTYVPEAQYGAVFREARIYVLMYLSLVLGSVAIESSLLLWLWIVPLLFGQPFLRLYLLAEHGRCAFVANMFENTRTTFTNRLVRFIAWNMPYHAEHHSYPQVPFHKLPELHGLAAAYLTQTEDGYAQFNASYLRSVR